MVLNNVSFSNRNISKTREFLVIMIRSLFLNCQPRCQSCCEGVRSQFMVVFCIKLTIILN